MCLLISLLEVEGHAGCVFLGRTRVTSSLEVPITPALVNFSAQPLTDAH